MPKIPGYVHLKQQANPLRCEFLCNKSGMADEVLQGSYFVDSKWFSRGDDLLKTCVCPRELVQTAENWTQT